MIVRRTHPTARTCDTRTHHGAPLTTVRLATLPRGPTTVVRRAAPPRRTAISIMEPACLSSPCSSSCGPATSAAAAVSVKTAQSTPAQIVAPNVRAKAARVERIASLSIAALSTQPRKAISQPHFHICASWAQSLAGSRPGRSDAASSNCLNRLNDPRAEVMCSLCQYEFAHFPGLPWAEPVPENSMTILPLRFAGNIAARHRRPQTKPIVIARKLWLDSDGDSAGARG